MSAPLMALLLLVAACGPERSSLFADRAADLGRLPNIQVLEGDTLLVDGRPLHLVDIVTPKPSPDARCPAEAVAARQARLGLKALTEGVKSVAITPAGGTDCAGRAEVHILLDHLDPAHELVEEGLAVARQKTPFDWCGPIAAALPRADHLAMLSISGT